MNGNAPKYFISIAEHQSLRAASEALHISQSALSRQIINLEQELGARLLERLPRGIALTEAGTVFLRYARDNVDNYHLALSEVSALQGKHRGVVRIAAQEAFMDAVLPECMDSFRTRFPAVRILAQVCSTREVVSKVHDGAVDFGLAFNPELGSEMHQHFSVPEKIVAAFAPNHPLRQSTDLFLKDLTPYALALPLPQTATGHLISYAAHTAGLILNGALESNSTRLRLHMSEASDLVSIFASIVVKPAIQEGRLVAKPLRDGSLNRGSITLFSSPSRRLSAAAKALQEIVHHGLRLAIASA